MSEKIIDFNVALTSRKIDLCKHLKTELIKRNIVTSDENIANAVAKLKNDCFITNIERKNNKIVLGNNVLSKLFKQNPNMMYDILESLSN